MTKRRGDRRQLTVQLTTGQYEFLEQEARNHGCSLSDVARVCVYVAGSRPAQVKKALESLRTPSPIAGG